MKRVLVTGGSRGLGLAICRALAQEGWQVLTVSRRLSPELQRAQVEFPDRILFAPADLSNLDSVAELGRQFNLEAGLQGFVANAAVGTEGSLTLTSRAEIQQSLNTNLLSVILLAKEVLKPMLSTGGSLVFISSVSAIRGFSGLSVYSAAKGALVSFSRTLAREYGSRGIRSNCVLPGFLETEMSQSLAPADRKRIENRTALRRLGSTADVVGTVQHLLSNEARFITGTEIVVDGGLTA